MGRFTEFMNFVKNKQLPDPVQDLGLGDGMIKLVLDQKVLERMEVYDVYMEILSKTIHFTTLNTYIDDLIDMIQLCHACVQRIAIPYIRGGDSAHNNKLSEGWSEVHSWFLGEALTIKYGYCDDKTLDLTKANINLNHVRNTHKALVNHYFSLADKVVSASFKDRDVRPNSVTIVQSMMPMMMGGGGEGTMPTSGGATSQTHEVVRKPGGGPYDEEMSSRVNDK